jgi:hypothetical protein
LSKKTKNSAQDKELILSEVTPYTELTILQRRYVEARMQGLPITAAGNAAGAASPQVSSSLERSPKVRKAIKYLIKDSTKNVEELSKSDVMTGMLDAVEAAATASELVLAWRELGKLIGAYEPEKKILEIHDYTKDELKQLSDDDLRRLSGGKYASAIDAEFEEIKKHAESKSEAESAEVSEVDGFDA